jgi:hypothetical protein
MAAVQENRTHADETTVFNGAAMYNGPVPHSDPVSHMQWVRPASYVKHTLVLNIGLRPYSNVVHISPNNSAEPDA